MCVTVGQEEAPASALHVAWVLLAPVSLGLGSSPVEASPPGSNIWLPGSHPLPYPRYCGLVSQLCQLGRASSLRFLAGEKSGGVREFILPLEIGDLG